MNDASENLTVYSRLNEWWGQGFVWERAPRKPALSEVEGFSQPQPGSFCKGAMPLWSTLLPAFPRSDQPP